MKRSMLVGLVIIMLAPYAEAEGISCRDVQGVSAHVFNHARMRPEARGRRGFAPDSIGGLVIGFELNAGQPIVQISLADGSRPDAQREIINVQTVAGGNFTSWLWLDVDGSINVMSYMADGRLLAWSIHQDRLGPLTGGAVVKSFTATCQPSGVRG
jgi:hypothetical protein